MSNLKIHRSSFIIHRSPFITSPKTQCGAPIKSPHCIRSRTVLYSLTHRIVLAHAPHCLCQCNVLRLEGTLIVMRVCKLIFYTPSLSNYSKYGSFPFNRSLMNTGEFPTSLKCFLPIYKSTVINAFGLSHVALITAK